MLFWNENHVSGSKSFTREINFIALRRQFGFSDLRVKYFCEKLNRNWSHCNEGLSVASVLFVKGAVTWFYSTDKLRDLPETTEQKSKALILVIASRHLKESWVFSRVFHLFSMNWQLTRPLVSINWNQV